MLTVKGEVYKDVDRKDFNHYFAGTCMAWKLGLTKRRLYLVSSVANNDMIQGTYLTREKQFKEKVLPFKDWWTALDCVVLEMVQFNVPGGAVVWKQQLNKNLRKSVPWNTNGMKFYGNVKPEDKTMQAIAYAAFSPLYGIAHTFRTLPQVLAEGTTEATREKFLVDRTGNLLLYGGRLVGTLDGENILLHSDKSAVRRIVEQAGISRDRITNTAKPSLPPAHAGPLPQKLNHYWKTGYQPEMYPESGYCLKFLAAIHADKPVQRTYRGPYPGPENILPGWVLFSAWGKQE